MRIVNIVMGAVDSMMGIMNGRMGRVTRHKRIGQAEWIRVSLITVSDGWAAARGHVIPWRSSLGRRREFPWRWRSVQWWCGRWWRCFTNFYTRDGTVARYSTTFPGWRLALKTYIYIYILIWSNIIYIYYIIYLSTIVLTRLSVIWWRWLYLYRTQR